MVAANIIRAIEDKALQMRELIVTDLIGEGKVGHLGGSCSSAEIVAALYFHCRLFFALRQLATQLGTKTVDLLLVHLP